MITEHVIPLATMRPAAGYAGHHRPARYLSPEKPMSGRRQPFRSCACHPGVLVLLSPCGSGRCGESTGGGCSPATSEIRGGADRRAPVLEAGPPGSLRCIPEHLAVLLPPCYLGRMSSSKKQTQLRLEPDVLAAGKDAAAARGLDFNRYVERLIAEDTSGARAAGMAAAQRLIDHHGDFLADLEADLDAQYAPAPNARGAAA